MACFLCNRGKIVAWMGKINKKRHFFILFSFDLLFTMLCVIIFFVNKIYGVLK